MSESSLATTGSAQRNQRLALVAVVGVAVIGVIVYLLLFAGGSSSKTPTATNAPVASAAASPIASASPSTAQAVPAAFTAAVGRNPFQPALTPPPVAVAAAAGTAAAAAKASPTPTPTPTVPVIVIPTLTLAPTGSPSPTPTVTVTATPSPTGLPTAATPLTLKVVRVDGSGTADVTVTNGSTVTPYSNVLPGQVFGTYFKLVSIVSSDPASPPVSYGADFQYGDQFVQLAQGQSAQLS
jgi:hypothetical protein